MNDNLTGTVLPSSNGVVVKEDNVDYYAVVTNLGRELIATALATKTPLRLTHIVLGDGEGNYVLPDREMTALYREVWRGECTVTQDPANPNMLNIRTNVPVDVGGWEVREIGVIDENENLVIIASAPGWRKLAVINGTSNPMEINILVTVTDASAIELNISYDGVSATLKDIENHNNSKDSHNGHFTDPNLHFNEQRLTRLRAGTNYELDCEKVGGVFQLSGLPEDIVDERVIVIFEAPEIYEPGNTWTVDGVSYTVKTSNGKPLKSNSFIKGAVLTAVLDPAGKILHFSALGSGGGGTVVSETAPDDTDVNWFNPINRLMSVYANGQWLAIAGVYGGTVDEEETEEEGDGE